MHGICGCATLEGEVKEILPYIRGLLLRFCLTKGSLFSLKSALQQGLFPIKIEVSPLENACSLTSKVKIFEGFLNPTFRDNFCPLFLEFAL